jgi:hypothetical protein
MGVKLTSSLALLKFGFPGMKNEGTYMTTLFIKEKYREKCKVLPSRIYCNRALAPRLEGVFEALYVAKKLSSIKSWNGCYVVRKKRTNDTYSLHSWGLAVDINMTDMDGDGDIDNTLGGEVVMDMFLVKTFEENGFNWGGRWGGKGVDGMHFELSADHI